MSKEKIDYAVCKSLRMSDEFIKLRHIRYFVTVARCLNFTEAARQLGITQSALSQQMGELEKYLDVNLFQRCGSSKSLTVAGEVFFKKATAILIKTESAVKNVRYVNEGFIGNIKIGFVTEVARRILPTIISKFRAGHSNVDLSIKEYTLSTLTKALKEGSVDIGCRLALSLDRNISDWKTLYTDVMALVVRYDHPLAIQKKTNFG
ncbi:MAG: transcriptional regulator AlsR family [Firmicutes bacterium]|nr:transcriptional regulator AlsR family [Bacillota bacterium]